MTEPRRPTDDELGRVLSAIARELEYPDTPSLASSVTLRLSTDSAGRVRPHFPALALWSRRRVLALVAIGLLAALALGAAARLAIGAFEVRVQPLVTPAPTLSPATPGELGGAAALNDAEREAGFAVALPEGPPPDEVYVIDTPFGDRGIIVAWQPGAPYPAIGGTKWSLVLMAFRGDAEVALKTVGGFEDVHETTVGGRPAFWIPVPHEISFETEEGTRGPYHVLGNVLIWQAPDGVSYRLETSLGRSAAIALAESAS